MRQRKATGGLASTPAAIAASSTSAPSVVAAETKSQTSASFSSLDGAVVAALLVVGLATRLWGIEDPKGFVFDETHFTKFATWYVSGHYYVDIHPPLAKLVFAVVLMLRGFVGAEEERVVWWGKDGFVGTKDWMLLYEDAYGNEYLTLRKVSAVVGAGLLVVSYLASRAAGCGRLAAVLCAWLVGVEAIVLLQSRLILCDVFLYVVSLLEAHKYFFNTATVAASFASVRSGLSLKSQLWWCVVTGLCLGCCLSVKLTALGILATVGVHQLLCLLVSSSSLSQVLSRGVPRAALILSMAAAVFYGLWAVHVTMLPYTGQGDGFMNSEYQASLVEKTFPGRPSCPNHANAVFPCGLPNITRSQCEENDCCWDTTSRKVKCYHKGDPSLSLPADACPNPRNTWSDCGKGGISEEACRKKGCCWDPTSPKAWCYHKGALQRPTMSLWDAMSEALRATWAINDGGAVMVHPAMSEWPEWPLMTGNYVPFGSTHRGGYLRALGNPGVYWPVFVVVLVTTALALPHLSSGASALVRGFTARGMGSGAGKGSKARAGAQSVAGNAQAVRSRASSDAQGLGVTGWVAEATRTNSLGGGGWAIPFTTLLFGYYINWVPYQLIKRSKFTYHYIPALLLGVQLAAFVTHVVIRWSLLQGKAWQGLGLALGLFVASGAGFWYWGLPYALGFPLTSEEHEARKWLPKW